jgi:hypothetical protein
MTAGQAAYEAYHGSPPTTDGAWANTSDTNKRAWESAARAARAWKEPTLGGIAFEAFKAYDQYDGLKRITNSSAWERAGAAVAEEVKRRAIAAVEQELAAGGRCENIRKVIGECC